VNTRLQLFGDDGLVPRREEGRRPQRARSAASRLALSPEEAAATLGVSRDFFDEHVMPELRIVRRGRRRLVPVRELERWLDEEAGRLPGPR
jgi:excisionase family DNA binding protein